MYQLYSPITRTVLKMAKELPRHGFPAPSKRANDDVRIHQTAQALDLEGTLEWLVVCDEFAWRTDQRKTIFLPSAEAIDGFLKAKYSLDDLSQLRPPFESFVLALPKGLKVADTVIPSCLVTWMSYDEYRHKTVYDFYKSAGKSAPWVESGIEPSDQCIALSYRDPYGDKDTVGRAFMGESSFEAALQATSGAEFGQACGSMEGKTKNVIASEPTDLTIQHALLKLVIALAIYHRATEGDRLLKGLPATALGVKMRSPLEGLDAKQRYQHYTVKVPVPKSEASEHYRRWHFRQLRHERYYQGDHAAMAPGSRWVFVNDTIVGEDLDPYSST